MRHNLPAVSGGHCVTSAGRCIVLGQYVASSIAAREHLGGAVITLHIEHAISDLATWRTAFDRFAPERSAAGVQSHTIRRPIDDPNYVVIDLEFIDQSSAEQFLQFLRTRIWPQPSNAPALASAPKPEFSNQCDHGTMRAKLPLLARISTCRRSAVVAARSSATEELPRCVGDPARAVEGDPCSLHRTAWRLRAVDEVGP